MFAVSLLQSQGAASQSDTSARLLPIIMVRSSAMGQPGQVIYQVDSNALRQKPQADLGEVLTWHSPVFIRRFGPGNLSLASIRGTGSAHTQVVWEGLPLNSLLLGQFDLSQVAASEVDRLEVLPGAQTSAVGLGSVGGLIKMGSTELQPGQWRLATGLGSFGSWSASGSAQYRTGAVAHRTRTAWLTARNDFPYFNANLERVRNPNGNQQDYSLMHDLQYQVSQHKLGLHVWWQDRQRQIQPPITVPDSREALRSRALRSVLSWQRKGLWEWEGRIGLNLERLNYEHPDAGIADRSQINSQTGQLRLARRIGQHRWEADLMHLWGVGQSPAFADRETQHRTQLVSNWLMQWHPKLALMASLGLVQADGDFSPPLPSLSAEWEARPWLLIRARAGRNLRIQTLNERYWANNALMPESGWQAESGFALQTSRSAAWLARCHTSFFANRIQNWILWRPGAPSWRPENIPLVLSRGLQLDVLLAYRPMAIRPTFHLIYTYTKATYQAKDSPATLGHQLIFIPEHQLKTSCQITHRRWEIGTQWQWVSPRYMDAGHTAYLRGFVIGRVQAAFHWQQKPFRVALRLAIDNLLGYHYQTVPFYAMPGRNWQLTLMLTPNQ